MDVTERRLQRGSSRPGNHSGRGSFPFFPFVVPYREMPFWAADATSKLTRRPGLCFADSGKTVGRIWKLYHGAEGVGPKREINYTMSPKCPFLLVQN